MVALYMAGQEGRWAPRRIQTFGVEWRNEYPEWAEDLPTERDGNLEAYCNAVSRVKDYVARPEYSVKESTASLKDVHSDPGLYSYDEWKAGKTAKSTVGPTEHEIEWKIDPKVWSSLPDIKDPMERCKILEVSRKRCIDHDYYTVKLQETFRDKGLQIIVNPSYPGEDWHTDGLLNEHIVGTAVYFFDMENVTGSRLLFRQEIEMNPGVYQFEGWDVPYLEELFGIKDENPALQELGSVFCPFELISKSRAGHLRFLTLWLVDPYYRICSTRNLPPQRHGWWAQEAQSLVASAHSLPQELASMVINEKHQWPMDLPEAHQHRLERGKDSSIAHDAIKDLTERHEYTPKLYRLRS
ncbi:hypothetical protein BDV27DRAFT_168430 [Aspergillus caelatus]|uniref:DUF4246 domain-containing protein n=1 Tax=Aspergillus caelatus TaxID=61420 RepID=A0A5N6ZRV7_9EURO|nr:uncharacterized protein BDV27DRAFT_168430 [Aspergillus caelatus]KAE8359589.1 hypothetical protein BDV27DRAFT_168430 [Aspergillus caelatus]